MAPASGAKVRLALAPAGVGLLPAADLYALAADPRARAVAETQARKQRKLLKALIVMTCVEVAIVLTLILLRAVG